MNLRALFGKRLKEIRNDKGLTQQELAELLDLQPNTIAQIEIGYKAASFDTIEKISKKLNISYFELFDFEETQSRNVLYRKITKLIDSMDKKNLELSFSLLEQVSKFKNEK